MHRIEPYFPTPSNELLTTHCWSPWGWQPRMATPPTGASDQDTIYRAIWEGAGRHNHLGFVPNDDWLLHLTARTKPLAGFNKFTQGRALDELWGGGAGGRITRLREQGNFLIQFAWNTSALIVSAGFGTIKEPTGNDTPQAAWLLTDIPTYALLFQTKQGAAFFQSTEGFEVIFRVGSDINVVPVMASYGQYDVLTTGEHFASLLDLVLWADHGIPRGWHMPVPGHFKTIADIKTWVDRTHPHARRLFKNLIQPKMLALATEEDQIKFANEQLLQN